MEIQDPLHRTRVWLGTFDNAEKAAMVYDRATIGYRGSDAISSYHHRRRNLVMRHVMKLNVLIVMITKGQPSSSTFVILF